MFQVQLTLHLYQHLVNPIRTFLYFHFFGRWSGPASEAIESSVSLESCKSKQWLHSYSYLILYHYCILFYGWCDVLAIFTGLICVDIRVDVDEDVQPHVHPQQLLLSKKLV